MYGQADVCDPKAGLASAQIAAEQSRSVSNALGGLSLLHVGEAYAMLGEHRRCEQALSQAGANPWRSEPAVQDVHDRLLALVARA